jgi:ubiquinone/menaquinone biosynthesis C-methylase UbiE
VPLSREEEDARNQFMKLWHEVLPKRFAAIERFNQSFPVRSKMKKGERILEIGAGLGEHIQHEPRDWLQYVCVELRPEMASGIRARFPDVEVVIRDCQEELPFEDGYFDRVLAIHVLEHLTNLPAAIRQIHRVLKISGRLGVCIPCEGGLAYRLARIVSAKRLFKKHFPRMNYEKVVVANEHLNVPGEIVDQLLEYFSIDREVYFPLALPLININLCIGLSLSPKPQKP